LSKKPEFKVLRVIARMNVGGPAFLIRGFMTRLDKNSFDQLLVFGNCNSNEDEIAGVSNLGDIRRISNLQREIDLREDLISVLKILRIIKKYSPNIIHTHTFKAGFIVRLPYIFRRKKNVILIHHYHGHLIEGYFGKFKKFVYLKIEKYLAIKTNIILTDGIKVASDLVAAGVANRDKFRTITPGVEEPNSNFKRSHDKQDKLVIGFVGRFTQIKRPDKFISLVEALHQTHKEIEFRMYGDGELKEQIRNYIATRTLPIELFDFASSAYEVLSDIDVLIVTSDNEGTPLTVMEASFIGVPCIATDVGAISEIVINGVNGYVVENSVDSLVKATLGLISDRDLLASLSYSSIEYAQKNFSMSRYVEQSQNIYLEFLNSGFSK